MARLIDADKIVQIADKAKMKHPRKYLTWNTLKYLISLCPIVDAVEVVRCKECKYGMKSHLQPPYEERTHLCRHSWEGEYHKPDHFCSYGERSSANE